jgi:anti-sigma-K factor RskA
VKLAQPELIEHLASQYALGTLSPRVRRRFEVLLLQRPDLLAAVQRWNARLNLVGAAAAPWSADTRKTAPERDARSRRMWQAIAAQTQTQPAKVQVGAPVREAPAPRVQPRRGSGNTKSWFGPGGWAGLFGGALAGAVCAVMVLTLRPEWVTNTDRLAMRIDERLPQSYVGLLTDEQGNGRALLSSLRHGKTATVKMLGAPPLPALPVGERYVLWALPADAKPFAVTSVPEKGAATSTLPDTSEKLFSKVSKLIVTIESQATPEAPSARVVLKGNCAKLW